MDDFQLILESIEIIPVSTEIGTKAISLKQRKKIDPGRCPDCSYSNNMQRAFNYSK